MTKLTPQSHLDRFIGKALDLNNYRRVLTLILFLFVPTLAYSEKCWLVGCSGDIAYIYLPESQIGIAQQTVSEKISGVEYRLNTNGKLLREYGLPPIGSVVTLNTTTPLLPFKAIFEQSIQKEIEVWPYIYDEKQRTASLYQYKFDETMGDLMAAGGRLQILGYVGDRANGYSHVFAMVMVVSN